MVAALLQPCWLARVIAYTSTIRPAVIEVAPETSKCRCASAARLSLRSHGLTARTATPTGRLTKKIHDQLRYEVRTPPSSTPTAPPMPDAAPQTPSAMLRSRPSRKVVTTIESAAGASSAPPSPCSARVTISAPSDQASPDSNEPSVKTATPAMNSRLRPSRSASRPPSSSVPPNRIE